LGIVDPNWGAREEGRCAGEASVVEVELASTVRPG